MLCHTQQTWLCLLGFLATTYAFSLQQSVVFMPKLTSNDYYSLAPELTRFGTFALTSVKKIGDSSKQIEVNVTISGSHYKYCTFHFNANAEATKVGVSSVRRLSGKKILLTKYDEFENNERKVKLLLVDLDECSSNYLQPEDIPEDSFIIVTNHDSDIFDVFVDDRKICGNGADRCRISYNATAKTDVNPFDIHFDWKSLRISQSSMLPEKMIVSGLDNDGTYRQLLLDPITNTRKEIFSLPNAKSMEIMPSSNAVCWIVQPGKDKTVSCSQFISDEKTFNTSVTFKEPVTLVSVNPFGRHKIFLFASKARCDPTLENCWNLFTTKLRPKMKEWQKDTRRELHCAGVKKGLSLEVHQIRDVVVAEYVCDNGDKLTYEYIVIDMTGNN